MPQGGEANAEGSIGAFNPILDSRPHPSIIIIAGAMNSSRPQSPRMAEACQIGCVIA